MIRKLVKSLYLAIISIAFIFILYASWTSYVLVSQSSKSSQINEVIQDMYKLQKSFSIDVVDLTKILIKDANKDIASENIFIQAEDEYSTAKSVIPQVVEPLRPSINRDNPLGIVIEPSEASQDLATEEEEVSASEFLPPAVHGDNPLGIVIEPSEVNQNLDDREMGIS